MDSRQEISTLAFACICVMFTTGCTSPQYAEVGKIGFVYCSLKEGNHDIYWRVTGSNSSDPPIAYFSKGEKGGKGYESGDYDILSNGNLVIKLVSYYHERTYEAIKIDSTDTSRSYYIDLKVTVTPAQKLPTVENCFEDELCLVQSNVDVLQCVVGGARPSANLSWLLLSTPGSQIQLTTTNKILTEEDSITFRTISNISLVPEAKTPAYVSLYSCRASYAPYDKSYQKEVVVDWSQGEIMHEFKSKVEYFEINSQAKLICSKRDKEAAYVWKKQRKLKFEAIAYRSPNSGNAINTDTYSINELGDLIIHNVNSNSEGNYSCVSSSEDNQQEIYQLIVIVTPSTNSAITITECGAPGRDSCTIPSVRSGELLCSISGIRPAVSLHWSPDSSSNEFTTLSGDVLVSKYDNYLYTVTRTVRYKISYKAECRSTFSLICSASGPAVAFLDAKEARVTLINEQTNCTDKYNERLVGPAFWWLIIVLPIIIVFVILLTALIVLRRLRLNQGGKYIHKLDAQDPEEMNPLKDGGTGLQEDTLKEQLLKYLTIAYETKIPDRDIYVMNKFSQLNPDKASSEDDRYIEISSYLDLFTKESLTRKKRLVVEGEAGCGKTSFAMRMAQEWLRKMEDSPMAAVEILIILSLIDFEGQTTVHDAVRKQLIPYDCQHKLSSSNIETILTNEDNKVAIFLDGFDEFIERNEKENKNSYLYQLIHNKVLSGAFVFILTRSVSFLRVYGDSLLPIVKLNSFTHSDINKYVDKRFAKSSTKVDLFQLAVKNNEHLSDLCKIPFFLEMITRMMEEINEFNFPNYSSMTPFFQDLVNMKYRKLVKDKKANYEPSRKLAQFAFDAVTKNKSAWQKDSLYGNFPEEELKTLLNLNIMKEIQQATSSTRNEDENTVVQFTHNIYKYFIGATFLAKSSKVEIKSCLEDIDILTCQHLLIFTCGLNSNTVEGILEYIIGLDDIFPYPIRDCVAMCLNEVKTDIEKTVQDLLTKQMTKPHGIDVLNVDRKSLKKAKAHVLELCDLHKISVSMMRFENISLSIKDGVGVWDNEAQIHYSLPPVETFLITDRFKKNADSSLLFSILKNIPSVKEITIYSTTKPSSLCDKDIQVLNDKKQQRLFLCWVNGLTKEMGIGGMECRYPSLYFKRWMTYQEASVVRYMRKFKTSFAGLDEQTAVTIMAEKGIDGLFDKVQLGFLARKSFSIQNEKFSDFLPLTIHCLQKIDDAPRKEDIVIHSKELLKIDKEVRPYLVLYNILKFRQKNYSQKSYDYPVQHYDGSGAKMSDIPVIERFKDIFFDVQV